MTLAEQLSFIEMITKARIFMSDQHDALVAIAASLRSLDVARQQLAELQRELATSGREFQAMFKEAVSYKEQLAEMRMALEKYGWHDIKKCDATNTNGVRFTDMECTCGFDAALALTSQPSRGKSA